MPMLECKKCGWQFWVDSQADVIQHEKICKADPTVIKQNEQPKDVYEQQWIRNWNRIHGSE